MRLALISIFAVATSMVAAPALAQQAERYQMEKSPNGYIRLDRQSGEMSICTEQAAQLVCKLAADDRQAYDSAIDRLQSSVDALEGRVAALETSPKSTLPSETEFDQTMSYMQRFFRGFMDVVKEFERDMRGSDEAPGQRT